MLTLNWKERTGGSFRMLRRLLASCKSRVNGNQQNWEETNTGLRALAAFATAILFRAQFLRLGIPGVNNSKSLRHGESKYTKLPSKTRSEGIFPAPSVALSLVLQLQANVQHRIYSRRNISALLALHITLQLSRENVMHDAITRNIGWAAGSGVDLVQGENEEFVSILLGISWQVGRGAPCGVEERGGTVGYRAVWIYL